MSSNVSITEATIDDVVELVPLLRSDDVNEIVAATGMDPAIVLELSFRYSTLVWAGRVDGELLCIFGVGTISLLSGVGEPWLLGSDAIDGHAKTFMRYARPYLIRMVRVFPSLVNYIDVRNTRSISWLKRLGFTILDPEPWGVYGLPFHRFEMRT